ncbi:MAG: cytochrome c oxidase assembly protein [Thermomonas hydrothermalis]|uniref:cytochrome c oxidase assembly protein n=1 Tax=Thermomonas hydrothermalis TaxID=213588 RepID=UPI00235540D1|nr:cytochrome c oxidase assembly protein [Thermomonas hydrothermalis]MCL6619103.1 cytochrome c oxidase assembly protein [Thermomonas hydrothermalis]
MAAARGHGVWTMAGVALLAFGFAFSMVPLYRLMCQKVFGVRLEQGPVAGAAHQAAASGRWVTVEFDGAVNSKLPWKFAPEQTVMKVQVGRPYQALYYARNTADRAIVGNAVPSVAPARASGYFNKTECFCFTAQTLAPGESRDMPVQFVIDPALPPDIKTITLSYTFFKNDALTAALQTPAGQRQAARAIP